MLSLNAIDHIQVPVTDLPFALAWYKEVLGLVPDARNHHPMREDMALLANPGGTVRLALSQKKGMQPHPGSIVFSVSGQAFHAWIDALAGLRVKDSEGETIARDSVCDHRFFYSIAFCDPFGNPYEIISYDHAWIERKLGTSARIPAGTIGLSEMARPVSAPRQTNHTTMNTD